MNLDKFYSLRTDFTIIGLTGRVGAGCSEIANKLADADFVKKITPKEAGASNNVENLKHNICHKYLHHGNNWKAYTVLKYKNVLLFHLIHGINRGLTQQGGESNIEQFYQVFIKVICQNGRSARTKEKWKNRLDLVDDKDFLTELRDLIFSNENIINGELVFGCADLNECLKNSDKSSDLFMYFFGDEFNRFADSFFERLNQYNAVLRTRLIHDLANNLRSNGSVINSQEDTLNLVNMEIPGYLSRRSAKVSQ